MSPRPRTARLAWAVESPLKQGEMKARLDESSPQPWKWGDSAIHGDYLGGVLTHEAVARIYAVDDGFVVELRFDSTSDDADARLAAAKEKLENHMLPLIEAKNVEVTDPLD